MPVDNLNVKILKTSTSFLLFCMKMNKFHLLYRIFDIFYHGKTILDIAFSLTCLALSSDKSLTDGYFRLLCYGDMQNLCLVVKLISLPSLFICFASRWQFTGLNVVAYSPSQSLCTMGLDFGLPF